MQSEAYEKCAISGACWISYRAWVYAVARIGGYAGLRVLVPWLLSYTGHTGVCALLRPRFYGLWGVMGYQDGSRLLGIRFC